MKFCIWQSTHHCQLEQDLLLVNSTHIKSRPRTSYLLNTDCVYEHSRCGNAAAARSTLQAGKDAGAHWGRTVPGEPEALWSSLHHPLCWLCSVKAGLLFCFYSCFFYIATSLTKKWFPQDVCVGENQPWKGLGELENGKLPIATCFWHSKTFISNFDYGFTNSNKANCGCASYMIT